MALVLIAQSVMAQGNLGQSGANFLEIGVTPRGQALGGAVTAIASGASGLYWNPAGAVNTQGMEAAIAHTDWFMDTKLLYGAVVKALGPNTAVGVSLTSFYMDDMEITTVDQSEGTGQFFSAGDMALGLSFAQKLTSRFTFGATVKWVREEIWNETAQQAAVDIGSLYNTDFLNLRIGMAVRNFGGKLKMSGDDIDARIDEETGREQENNPRIERLSPEYRMPQVFQLGVAFEPKDFGENHLTVLADVIVPSDAEEQVVVGLEYDFQGLAYLRGGYRVQSDLGHWSMGGGVRLSTNGVAAMLDYAFSSRGVLGNVHQFGFAFSL